MRYLNTILSTTVLALLFLLPRAASGQQPTFNVQGSVRDTAGRAIAGVNVGLWQDTVLRAAAASDSVGSFTLRGVRPGEYRFEAVCLGYTPVRQTVSVNASLQPLAFAMRERAEEMEAVRVVASRTKVEPDGTLTFQAQNAPVAKGRSSLEMLRFVQGLTVSGGQVLINGKSGTKIFRGDSRKTMTPQELSAIPATEIERVVVETQAGVEHGASSEGGILRVYLVPHSGLSGTLEGSMLTNGTPDWLDPRINLTLRYQKGKFFMQHELFYSPYFKYTTLYRYEQIVGADTTCSDFRQVRRDVGPSYNLTLSYDIADGHTVSLYSMLDYVGTRLSMEDSVIQREMRRWGNRSRTLAYGAGMEYIGALPVGKQSQFKLWTSCSNNREKGHALYYDALAIDSAAQRSGNLYVEVAPSLSFTLGGGHRLQGGVNFDFSNNGEYTAGTTLSNFSQGKATVDYLEKGGDVRPWVQYDNSFANGNFYLRLGVTGLYYWGNRQDHANSERSYSLPEEWGVFPKLLLQYRFSQEKQVFLRGEYSFLYSLPNYFYFSPVVTYVTANQYSVGNRALRMEKIHTAGLTLFFLQDWQLQYRFRYCPNLISVMTHADSRHPGMSYLRPENAGTLQRHHVAASYNTQLFDFWYTSNELYCRYELERSEDASAEYVAVGGSTTQDFSFYEGIGMYVTFEGAMGNRHLSKAAGPFYALSAALYASFLDDQLQLNFSVNNIVRKRGEITTEYGNSIRRRIEAQGFLSFELGVTWSFAHGQRVKSRSGQDVSAPGKAPIQL